MSCALHAIKMRHHIWRVSSAQFLCSKGVPLFKKTRLQSNWNKSFPNMWPSSKQAVKRKREESWSKREKNTKRMKIMFIRLFQDEQTTSKTKRTGSNRRAKKAITESPETLWSKFQMNISLAFTSVAHTATYSSADCQLGVQLQIKSDNFNLWFGIDSADTHTHTHKDVRTHVRKP